MVEQIFDLVVLGGGNAVALAIRAARAGKSVALIEKDRLGGTCPNRGCIPSKLLVGHADVAATVQDSRRFGVSATIDAIDRDDIFRSTRAATWESTDGKIAGALPETVRLFRGHGRFTGPRTIAVGDAVIQGETIVVATGTRPYVPARDDIQGTPYWTSDDVFELDHAPKSIAIIGGGFIACELAHVFAALGVETVQIVRGKGLLVREDGDIRRVFEEGYREHVDVRLETELATVSHDTDGFSLGLAHGDGVDELRVEALMFATGRIPNTTDIGLDAAGIGTDERGWIKADDRLRTNVDGIFAMGDVKGRYLFTHAAAWEADYLGDVILEGREGPIEYGPIPHAVFTHPEIAGVGPTEQALTESKTPFVRATVPYTSAAKGRAIKEQHGLCKLMLAPDGEILACHIVGRDASILLHEVIPVMKWRNHISSLTGIIHIHPSLSEVVRNCARKAESTLAEAANTRR